jgi:hypothetical protein
MSIIVIEIRGPEFNKLNGLNKFNKLNILFSFVSKLEVLVSKFLSSWVCLLLLRVYS